ncbi:TniQ family protein [Streptomyces violascens]|uniref:TniQ family protein n=1 Tax=Streptomyces violascens TaxID=67381 RepID=UPI001673EE74|nr:TniQ family protein [Streptomyces violascens]GGU52685.1 hypothetical protein GCM10010289_86070 [Streptomyces violascens]
MTNPRRREQDRAVRAYKRAHPGITLHQARQAVADRTRRQQNLPARIPGVPLPRPTERLDSYVQRVAATAGVQRHRAMELLGLAPGTSATERLDNLAHGLDDDTVRALVAATGMTPEQARALTTPRATRPDLDAVRRITETTFAAGRYRRGGEGKTSTSRDLARLLAETYGSRVLPVDLPVHQLFPTPYRPVIADLDWPSQATRPSIAPEAFDEAANVLGTGQGTSTDAPRHE